MMAERWRPERVFVYRHPVDMRKQIDGLAALVATELGQDPADRSMYVFTNRGRDKIKLLIWHLNGYWLLYKRVEKQRFQWLQASPSQGTLRDEAVRSTVPGFFWL